VVGSAFGSSSSWILGRWGNPLSCDLYLSHDTCNTDACIGFDLCLILDSCSRLWVMIISFRTQMDVGHSIVSDG
jgi:hypothetical protein